MVSSYIGRRSAGSLYDVNLTSPNSQYARLIWHMHGLEVELPVARVERGRVTIDADLRCMYDAIRVQTVLNT